MKRSALNTLPLLVMFVAFSVPVFAQNCNPNIPIDGGISALLAAGAGYGIKKLNDKRKSEK